MELFGVMCTLLSLGVLGWVIYAIAAAGASSGRWQRMDALEREVAELRARLAALEGRQDGAPAVSIPEGQRSAAAPAAAAPSPSREFSEPIVPERIPSARAAPSVPHPVRPQPEMGPQPVSRPPERGPRVPVGPSLEERIGGQWLGWLGAVTVAVTVALAIAWAYREGWITPLVILGVGWLVGAGLLAAGERLRPRLPTYGQGLAGAGVAALYITTYAGHAAYGTLSAGAAAIGLIGVGALAILTALRYDSIAIGWLGIVLAYASPVLLGSDAASPAPLFLYLTGLNTAVLAISIARHWVPFRAAAFGATVLLYAAWHLGSYSPEHRDAALAFVGTNWAIFLAGVAVYPLVRGEATTDADLGVAALNPIASMLAFYAMLHPLHNQALALIAVLYAAVYYGAARSVRARRGTEDYLEQLFFAASVVFALLAIPFQFQARAMAAAWALAGAALTVVGSRTGSLRTRAWGGAALFLALARLLLRDAWLAPGPGSPAFFNERGFSFFVVSAAFAAAAGVSAGQWKRSGYRDPNAAMLLGFLALIVTGLVDLWIALDLPDAWVPPVWSVAAALVLGFGWQLRSRELRAVGLLAGLPPVLAAVLPQDPAGEAFWPVPARIAALALAVGAAYAFECLADTVLEEPERAAAVPLAAAAAAAVAMTWSADHLGRGWLPVSWMGVALLLLGAGWLSGRRPLRLLGLAATAALTVEVLARELPLPPGELLLLNGRAAAAVAAVGAWSACAWVFARVGSEEERALVPGLAVIANLVALGWVSLEAGDAARRMVRAGAGEAARFALSAVWVIYAAAAIAVGFWKRIHAYRWGGMGLLLVAVAKVYLVDMAFLALGYRVLSFLVLALVLLGVSYLYQRQAEALRDSERADA